MLHKRVTTFFGGLALLMTLFAGNAFADKSAVSIQAPSAVSKGSEVVFRVTVTHNANNFLHYTEWLYVMANGKEIARWKYSSSERPEAETFTKEVKYTVTDNLEIKAEASCNMHGSAGPETLRVSAKD